MKKLFTAFVLLILFNACSSHKTNKPVDFVNPFIGTGGHGHTYPGATVPFGMVQLSPDTRKDSWDGCSGYHYSDSVVFGFSHTHLSGTGIGDYGDIRLMPLTGELKTEPGTSENPDAGYASRFDHGHEMAQPGFYAVRLSDYNIFVALTATERAGFHKYLFPAADSAFILIDLKESVVSETILESEVEVVNDSTIRGFRRSRGWAADQYIYFHAVFSKPFDDWGIVENTQRKNGLSAASGTDLKAFVRYATQSRELIFVKVGISAVDYKGAENNLQHEIPGWNFAEVKARAREKWNRELGRIRVEGASEARKTVFYTALYHSLLAPNIYSDADGRYRKHRRQIARSETPRYTVFSLWDTFRALHPLFTVIQRERTVELIETMLDFYTIDGLLPVWELAANETDCMIGYHAVPVIADAYAKGIRGFDAALALEAMQASAQSGLFGLEWYTAKGYIPADKAGESVSKTLEYAYDDWCIARMAQMLENEEVYDTFIRRAQYYKNIFDKESGFFRGKSNGSFVEPFDPAQVNFMLTEANTWQYNFFVPQDVNTHIDLLGGNEAYIAKLDELFSASGLSGRKQSDITGLIGQYAHGNEPSHHMAYLYSFAGAPWKTQELVHRITNELYSAQPDGLSGNEDCGQMSAWYVLSAMGFYPVTPGSPNYILGTPAFEQAEIRLENGNTFRIKANNLSPGNFYVQSVNWKGEPWTKSYITHDMIMEGGELVFEMGPAPNKSWGSAPGERPVQRIAGRLITPVPYFQPAVRTFETELEISLSDLVEDATLYLSTDPAYFGKYVRPLRFDRSSKLYAKAVWNGRESFAETAEYYRIPKGRKVKLKHPYSKQYTAGGDLALVNTLRGGSDFRTGNWQGYHGVDLDAVIDLGESRFVLKIGAGFLQDQNSWIFMPEWVRFEVSADGKTFAPAGKISNKIDPRYEGSVIRDFVVDGVNKKIRFVRILAKNRGLCPAWHKGAGEPAWIFVDELWVE
ncbi:MAG: GH92 family glycosyl hydrolase [Bacteroidales bacterium]|nr:GH92 family glycosyl hydrolase [Bacteroidales bacterium]